MGKAIKVEKRVYDQLEQLRGKRETFSEVVAKLLTTKEGIDTLIKLWSDRGTEREK